AVDADVLVPELGVFGDEQFHHRHALGVVEHHHLDAVFGQPLVTTEEGAGLADHDPGDAELADETGAVPARRQRRRHRRAPVGAAPPGGAEGGGLAVDGGVAVLDPAVVALSPQLPVGPEQGRPDGDASGVRPPERLLLGDLEHLLVSHTREGTWSATQAVIVSRGVPGVNTSANPARFRASTSSSGMTPPPKTRMSEAPRAASSSTTLGKRAMCAPEREDNPTASTSSCTAVSAICAGVWWRPE